MHATFHFFTPGPGESEAILFTLLLLACWNLENLAAPAVNYRRWHHAFLNAHFIVTGILPQAVMGYLLVKTMQWTTAHHFGLLYHLSCSGHPFILFIASFLLLDLGEYLYHVIMHKSGTLWMFHAVHHSDHFVDVSTTLREHPGENVIRNCFTIVWIFFSGALFRMFFLRQLVQIASNLLVHMNYRLPDKVDRVVSILFITPNLHQVHHHYKKPYTDRNYGDVLSIWDRMFGTFCRMPYEDIVFGVDSFMDAGHNPKYLSLMKMPFRKAGNKPARRR